MKHETALKTVQESQANDDTVSTSYQGLFIRDYVGETSTEAGSGGWTNSPDIICNGPNPISDPALITNSDYYNVGWPASVGQLPGVNNFVYIRGKNVNAPNPTSTVYFYYAPMSISLLPVGWQTSHITYNGETTNKAVINVGSNGDIVDTTPAFLWTPPKAHEHYCLVAWARNGTDQGTAPTLPSINTWSDLGTFILNHPDVAWQNVAEISPQNGVIQHTCPIDNPPQGGKVSIGLSFDNVPVGGTWEMTVPLSDNQNFHQSGLVQADQPYAVTFPVNLPDDWKTSITFKYTPLPGIPLPDNASIEPLVISGITEDQVATVKQRTPHRLFELDNSGDRVQYGMVLGSVRYNLKS